MQRDGRSPDLDRLRQLAESIRTQPAPAAGRYAGRGIVVVAGGAHVFTNAYVLLHMLRHALQSRLPVELWHFGAAEISPAMAALLTPLEVRLVDAQPVIAAAGASIRDGWQLKAFALLHSGFAEVLLLDADQVPVRDPALLFDWPEYRQTGAVFWPDIIDLPETNPVWEVLGLGPRDAVSFESGQLLVNKAVHGRAITAAVRLNEAADDLYQLIYGDKDSYLLAWEMVGAAYALVPHRPFADEFYLVQRDFAGKPLFQHRCNAKWQYGGEQRRLHAFVHEEACLAALAELRANWSGRVFLPPDRTVRARASEAELTARGIFELSASGEAGMALELRPHAEIGAGRAHDRRHWWVEEDTNGLQLVLSDGERRTYQLARAADDSWHGRRFRTPLAEVMLAPPASGPPVRAEATPGLVDAFLQAAAGSPSAPTAPAQLTAALQLLARVTPGVAERLQWLAGRETDPEQRAVLLDAAATLRGIEPPQPRQVDRSSGFNTRYTRPDLVG